MPNIQLKKPLTDQEGFVGISGTAPRSGTVSINSITPRVTMYVRIEGHPDEKIWTTRALPLVLSFEAGEEFQAFAVADCTVNYTLNLS